MSKNAIFMFLILAVTIVLAVLFLYFIPLESLAPWEGGFKAPPFPTGFTTDMPNNLTNKKENTTLGKVSYKFLLADTLQKRILGLSGKDSLPSDTVLLFSFQEDSDCGIWMKDMKFSIDAVWFDSDFKVIHLEENISPDTYPQVFSPSSSCRYFIEANAGFIKANDINVGDEVFVDFAEFRIDLR